MVVLSDGSFVLCQGRVCDRFSTTDNKAVVELVGTFVGHTDVVMCAFEKDDNVLVTGSRDRTIKEWNLTTCDVSTPSHRETTADSSE